MGKYWQFVQWLFSVAILVEQQHYESIIYKCNLLLFSGDVEDPPASSIITVSVESTMERFWETGHYLLPGEEMIVTVPSEDNTDYTKYYVLVGLHTDKLKDDNRYFYRYPIMTVSEDKLLFIGYYISSVH